MTDNGLQFTNRKFRGLSGNQIKMIAFFLMLCEGIGAFLILNGKLYAHNAMYYSMALETVEGQKWLAAAKVLRFLGRIAFPIFAYFIAEGFRHTSSVGKYIFRVGFFAALSEIPFDLAYYGEIYYPEAQNVMITYFIALVALYFIRLAAKFPWLQVIIALPFCYIAWLFKCDYGAMGVALVCAFYILRHVRKAQLIVGFILCVVESLEFYGISALAILFLALYNGTRGDVPMKYFFYLMYPVHMAGFYALTYFANK